MNAPNPYAPPKAPVADLARDHGPTDLAGRGQRLGAVLLDALISMVWAIPLYYVSGSWGAAIHHQRFPFTTTLMLTVVGFVGFAAVNFHYLQKNGQTIGKKLAGVRIATLDDGVPTVGRTLGLRYGITTLVTMIPLLGSLVALVDTLFIFRGDRRCIHDLIAGTKVLRA